MHYKNGRPAITGDPVIVKDYNRFVAGTIHSLSENSTACNGQVAFAIPGGVNHACVTVGECYHAEDAFAAINAPSAPEKMPAPPQAMPA